MALPTPPASSSTSWDHVAALLGGVLAVAVGAIDLFVAGQHITAAGDVGLVLAGLAALGVKGRGA